MAPNDLLSKAPDLPSLPDVYYQVEEVLDDPEFSLEQLADAIQSDPSISARLLKLANSAYYGFPAKIDTIHRAATIIGTQEIRELVLATAVLSIFQGMPVGAVSMRSFWEHSIACGLAARAIADCRGEANVEKFYVAGLLHDIGRMVLFLDQSQQMSELLPKQEEHNKPLVQLELETFGTCHGAIGGALLRQWNLPPNLCQAVELHHMHEPDNGKHLEAATVHLADLMVNAMRMGNSGNHFVPKLDEAAWKTVGLAVSDLDDIVIQTEERLADVITVFIEG
ncbi:MAG: HDOD domain-containing protein [Candidatus Sedimenticola sp. 6PFRAG7]